jgi:hypothetical protein
MTSGRKPSALPLSLLRCFQIDLPAIIGHCYCLDLVDPKARALSCRTVDRACEELKDGMAALRFGSSLVGKKPNADHVARSIEAIFPSAYSLDLSGL